MAVPSTHSTETVSVSSNRSKCRRPVAFFTGEPGPALPWERGVVGVWWPGWGFGHELSGCRLRRETFRSTRCRPRFRGRWWGPARGPARRRRMVRGVCPCSGRGRRRSG